jgi:autoinducer 2-degrading protein
MKNTKITLKGHIEIPAEDLEAVVAELINHSILTQTEKGCLEFKVEKFPDNPLTYKVYEEFVDKEAFEFHQERIKGSKWAIVSKNVKRVYEIDGL